MCKKLFLILVVFLTVFMFSGCNNGSCTVTKSYGTNSFTKDAANTCVKKLAGATCYKNSSQEDIANIVAGLQKYELVFNKKKCYDFYEKDEHDNYKRVKCPDIIPEKIKISKFSGCNIYYDGDNEHTDCATPCPEIYFSTDNDMFKTVAYQNDWGDEVLFSQSADGKAGFTTYFFDYQGSFSWSETAEDGREIRKHVRIEIEIVDPDTVKPEDDRIPAQCEDDGGRIYTEGDIIPNECSALVCSEEGWKPYEAFGTMSCYDDCDPNGLNETRYWDCPDGDELEWCICEEEDENGVKWYCIERIDLQCPPEEEF